VIVIARQMVGPTMKVVVVMVVAIVLVIVSVQYYCLKQHRKHDGWTAVMPLALMMPMPMMRTANHNTVAAAVDAEVPAAVVVVADDIAVFVVVVGVHFAAPNYHTPIIPCPKRY
jgi:hypothetical protein